MSYAYLFKYIIIGDTGNGFRINGSCDNLYWDTHTLIVLPLVCVWCAL